jgi:pimeloyl-ACP methyl ester carboxylesterase
MTNSREHSDCRPQNGGHLALDEGFFAPIGGLQQWITIRGADVRNPVLLIVGGPGYALSALAPFFAPWESVFTLVQWDQPGAGVTHANPDNPPLQELTLARLVQDGLAVVERVCERLKVDKLLLLGMSGGSAVALSMVAHLPVRFAGYIGCGQIVNWARQDALSYRLLCQQARDSSSMTILSELERIGPPPYPDSATDAVKAMYATAMTAEEQAAFSSLDAGTLAALRSPPVEATYVPRGIVLENPLGLSFKTYDKLRDELHRFDAGALGRQFSVPLLFLQGEHDLFTITSEVQQFIEGLDAPRVELVTIRGGGHNCIFLRDRVLEAMRTRFDQRDASTRVSP